MYRRYTLGKWTFIVRSQDGAVYVSVPDQGGMADSVPRDAEQHLWAVERFAGLRQVWETSWQVDDVDAIDRLLRAAGATVTFDSD